MKTNTHNPLSLYGSQRNCEAMEMFTKLVAEIHRGSITLLNPKEKLRILKEVLYILTRMEMIRHMSIRSLDEEFESRWGGQNHKKIKFLAETGGLTGNIKVMPLYAPTNGNQLWLRLRDKEGPDNVDYDYYYYCTTKGTIISLTSKSFVRGVIIETPVQVSADVGDIVEKQLMVFMHTYPSLFDDCMRQLIQLVEYAIMRAQERVVQSTTVFDRLRIVAQSMREIDLTTMILLACEKRVGTVYDDKIAMFQKIVTMCGSDFSTRYQRLMQEMERLEMKEIISISGLPYDITMAIIRGSDLPEKK